MFRTEPEAAAASYALGERVDIGSTIAVYDLGGGTFDAAVVRKTGVTTFSVLGVPQGIEQSGGVDFDDAVFGHVVAAVPGLTEMDPEDPATLDATAALRRECTAAKEALSVDTEVTIPVLAPEVRSQVRLVRAEFEDMIRVRVAETVESLRQRCDPPMSVRRILTLCCWSAAPRGYRLSRSSSPPSLVARSPSMLIPRPRSRSAPLCPRFPPMPPPRSIRLAVQVSRWTRWSRSGRP